jgi:hypothetical protein
MVSTGLHPSSTEFVRLSPSTQKVADVLGPLAGLVGTWMGSKGYEIVAVPGKNPNGKEGFLLIVRPYIEIITFSPIGAAVPDRGYPDNLFITGVQYEMRITDAETNQPLHLEVGMWFHMPQQPQTIARSATIPHGDALLALGNSTTIAGPPTFPTNVTVIPVVPGAPSGYTDAYINFAAPFKSNNVDAWLQTAIAKQDIVQTVQLDISTANGGGILNIPFVTANANATAFTCTYWIETVKDAKTGDTYQQLQYSQQTNLNFLKAFDQSGQLIMWPHVNMNTLLKQ